MKALYFNGIPACASLEKANDPSNSTVMGVSTYLSEVFPALLEYASFDHFYLPEISPKQLDSALSIPQVAANLDRISFIPEHLQSTLCSSESLVLMSPTPHLLELEQMRLRIRRPDAPITGVVHSLNYRFFLTSTLLEMLSTLGPYDALFTASTAGIESIRRRIQLVSRRHWDRFSLALDFKPQLLHIPLGINSGTFAPRTAAASREARAKLSIPVDSIVILYFGRLSPISKADLMPLIIAFSQLPLGVMDLTLVLAGDDTQLNLANSLRDFSAELGCAANVLVSPNPLESHKHELYAAADIFVSPSDCIQETFGITILEAMAASLPIIASDWDGYRDIVVDGENGFLIPTLFPDCDETFTCLQGSGTMVSEDILARSTVVSLPHLSDALLLLCRNRELRTQFGLRGRALVEERYDWKRVIARYEDAWTTLAAQARQFNRRTTSAGEKHVESYPYRELFGHYATRIVGTSDVVELSEFGKRVTGHTGLLDSIAIPRSVFTRETFATILAVLESGGPMSVDQMLGIVLPLTETPLSCGQTERTVTILHITRLVKYGLIQTNWKASLHSCHSLPFSSLIG